MSVGKAIESVYAAPFWIGFFVTLIAAITASGVIGDLKRSFGASLDDARNRQLQQYLTRDFDAVQSVASIVSVIAAALLLVHLSSVEGAIAFVAAIALVVAIFTFFRISPAWYSHYSKGAFTPLVDFLLFLNLLGLSLVALLHLRLPG